MPFLNWREHPVNASVAPHARRGSELVLEFPRDSLDALIKSLEDVFTRAQGELRLDLPRGWAMFWKEREGESRLLLAHPAADAWVATAALTREHGMLVTERLREGSTLSVGEVIPVASMSNVEISLKPGA